RSAIEGHDVVRDLLQTLPDDFARWTPLAQDQHLEETTLLAGYLLSSQGDRMLMANGVEGRFPFLDVNVVELARSLPPRYRLNVLDEKHVLKRASRGLVPEAVVARKKQPYRAPDAASFVRDGSTAHEWVEEVLSEATLRASGIFDVVAVRQLWEK